jgi:hypothetical protein
MKSANKMFSSTAFGLVLLMYSLGAHAGDRSAMSDVKLEFGIPGHVLISRTSPVQKGRVICNEPLKIPNFQSGVDVYSNLACTDTEGGRHIRLYFVATANVSDSLDLRSIPNASAAGRDINDRLFNPVKGHTFRVYTAILCAMKDGPVNLPVYDLVQPCATAVFGSVKRFV